jgi:hypothetical protein
VRYVGFSDFEMIVQRGNLDIFVVAKMLGNVDVIFLERRVLRSVQFLQPVSDRTWRLMWLFVD